jgi:hypothetical protein
MRKRKRTRRAKKSSCRTRTGRFKKCGTKKKAAKRTTRRSSARRAAPRKRRASRVGGNGSRGYYTHKSGPRPREGAVKRIEGDDYMWNTKNGVAAWRFIGT